MAMHGWTPRPGELSPAEKARRTRQDKVTWAIFALLNALPETAAEPDVVRVFAEFKAKPAAKCDAFWELDNKPGRFSGISYLRWHSLLRRTRNHPVHGRAMFATFEG